MGTLVVVLFLFDDEGHCVAPGTDGEEDMNHIAIDDDGTPEALYVDLLKKCLTRHGFGESFQAIEASRENSRRLVYAQIQKLFASRGIELVR